MLGTESTLREQFVLYSALSAAAERLTITYARQNIAGDAQLAPAGYLLRVLRPLQVTPIRTEAFPAEFWVVNAATAKSRYAAALGRDAAEEALLAALLERLGEGDYPAAMRRVAMDAPAGDITPENAPAAAGPGAEAGPHRHRPVLPVPLPVFLR